ncbi:MAG: secretin N-terminal domain-containing protein [Acidobacteriota bacterium]
MTKTRNSRAPRFPRLPGLAAALVLALLAASCATSRAFRDGEREEARRHWDLAVVAYERALALDPKDSAARISLQRARFQAAQSHYERGRLHRSAGQLDLAAAELEVSIALDSTNDSALQELRRAKTDIETRNRENAGGTPVEKAKARTKGMRGAPPMLNPSSTKPIDVAFAPDTNIKKIYAALGAAAGINIIYDAQIKDDRFTLDLRGMTFQKALETAMRQAGHFYKVIDEKTILIAQDTQQNRKEYEDLVIRTFFLSNGDVKDVSAMVRSILDLRRLGTIPALNAIIIRDTADKVAVAERLIEVNDKAKSEVVVDVELLQVNTEKLLNLGTSFSDKISASVVQGAGGGATTVATSLPWNAIKGLGINDFMFTIPTITFNFLKQNTDAELLAKPQLRIAEGEKAQLVIGDRVPIPVTTISTQPAIGQPGVIPITSYQYQDVGIKIDMEPRVHHNKEVSLKLTIEVSQLGAFNKDGQPTIGTRTITSSIRLKDGETNFLAGLIRKDTTKTKNTIPFLGDLPLIGTLFTNNNTSDRRTDLYLTLTPHIIRSPQITEEDLTPIWVGTENNVSFSGLNTRLESPNAMGSPFDAPPAAAPRPAVRAVPPATPSNPNPTLIQGSGPNDPFKRPVAPAPQPAIPTSPHATTTLETQALLQSAAAAGPMLRLEATPLEVGPGDLSVVNLMGDSGLDTVAALELTIEWDPFVAEVTGIAPGPWRSAFGGDMVLFDADRVAGRAHLRFKRTGGAGMPDGVLATLVVRGVTSGTTLVRVTAGAASTTVGATPAPRVEAASLTVKKVP